MATIPSLSEIDLNEIFAKLDRANADFQAKYPGDSNRRQPVHSVYGGAHLFKKDTAQKLGGLALRSLEAYAPDAATLAGALGLKNTEIAETIYYRLVEKLKREPTEDFRLDFEDGYGNRTDAEEDGHATSSAAEVARGFQDGTLPPFIGIRIKPLNHDLRARAIRTLDIFISTLTSETEKRLPENFVITIPKIQTPEQVSAAVQVIERLELKTELPSRSLKLELMIETPQAIIDSRGACTLPSLITAAQGRCESVHFGVYDYTAERNIVASYQSMRHPACDFAREMITVSLTGTGIHFSDGATNILPIGPHRASPEKLLTKEQEKENRDAIHRAWKLAFDDTLHSLKHGIYLSRLGSAPRTVHCALCGGLFVFSRQLATRRRSPESVRRKGCARLAARRCVRRRGDRSRPVEFLSARNELRCHH